MMIFFINIDFDFFFLQFFGEEKEGKGDANERGPADEETSPPHADEIAIGRVEIERGDVIRKSVHMM